jgi:two-component system, OmpR family, KDP operon response regulator KdpE
MSEPLPLVLVVEDEPPMRRFLKASLDSHGYRVLEASTLREAEALATSHNPELVLLDLGLPDGDGIDFTRKLRGWSRAPIVVVSARGREDDKVLALDAGADDYLTKPFGMQELLARLRVALRHARSGEGTAGEPILTFGALQIDRTKREVLRDGHPVHLTPGEYRLLAALAQHIGKLMTHRQLLTEVWGPGHASDTHYLRVRMAELRKKLEDDPARPKWLLTEAGVGYRLREPER